MLNFQAFSIVFSAVLCEQGPYTLIALHVKLVAFYVNIVVVFKVEVDSVNSEV